MNLSDLDEVKRLAQSRPRLLPELAELRAAETALVDITSKVPGSGVLRVSLIAGPESLADAILFQAVIDVLVMGFEKRLAKIDARLADLGVTP